MVLITKIAILKNTITIMNPIRMIVLKAKCRYQNETTNAGKTHLTFISGQDKNMQIYSEKDKGVFKNMEEGKEYEISIKEINLVEEQLINPLTSGGYPIPTGITIDNTSDLSQISYLLDKDSEEDKEYFQEVILPIVSKDIMRDDIVLNIKEKWGL